MKMVNEGASPLPFAERCHSLPGRQAWQLAQQLSSRATGNPVIGAP